MTVSACPSPDQLELLLHDEIVESVRVALELHIADCSHCQRRLVERPHIDDWQRLLTNDSGPSAPAVRRLPETRSIATERTAPSADDHLSAWPGIPGFDPIRELGRGGSSVVYAARQQKLGRIVAIKLLPESATHQPDRQLRFQNEARLIAQLQHPGIVQVFDTGDVAGRAWIAQEYCDGGSLSDRINHTPQPPTTAAETVWQLALAVQHAHDVGIIHRDIKPDNVLFLADTPRLADFGLARILDVDTGITRTADVMGTPGYMAPEQACGDSHAIGSTSDIYALGGVLYEMLTGSPPFLGTTVLDTLRLVVEQDPVPPRRLQPHVPRDLEVICLKCLAKDPAQRYANAKQLADDLTRFREGRPIVARPLSVVQRIANWSGRNRLVAALGLAVSVFAVALLAVWGYLTLELNWSNTELTRRSEELRDQTQQAVHHAAAAEANLNRQIAANESLQEVLQFFTTDLFDAATTEQQGVNLTVLEVLEQADEKISTRSLNRPNVEAALRLAIGNTLFLTGQPRKAVVHLERADSLHREHDPFTMTAFDCRQSFARCLRKLGEKQRAARLIQELTTDQWAPDDLRRIRLAIDLFNLDTEVTPLEDKVAAIRRMHEEGRDKLGPQHVVTLSLLSTLAETWFRAGKYEKALEIYRSELAENEEALGQNHLNTFNAANNVAVTLIRMDRLAEAEEIHRVNYRRQLMFRGPRDVGTMGTKHNVSMILWRQNKRQESVDLLKEVVADKSASLGPVENRTQQSLYQIGRMFLEMKQHQEGFEFFGQHFQPYVESARPTTQWVDLFNVFGQLATFAAQYDTAEAALTKSRTLLDSMGEGFGSQRNALKSAETALAAARQP